MANTYKVEIISEKTKDKIVEEILKNEQLYERKAALHGTCLKFFTNDHEFKDMWEDNFEPMFDWIRPHGRLFAISGKNFRVMYEPKSKTAIVQGCDYYGWVKSIALGIVADFLEDFTSEHRRHSVHGSFIDSKGQGIAMIGPSGSGKTTLTYGLLLDKSFSFVTDDWFFVRFAANDSLVYSSEKNSYIRGDLADAWPVYSPKLKGIKQDNRQRSIVDVKKLIGQDRIRHESNLVATVLLTRDKSLMPFRKLNAKEAIEFMLKNNFCNPHQLVKNKEKLDKRKKFFSELFRRAPVYLLNTIETPAESMQRIKDIWNK